MGIICDVNILLDILHKREPYWSDAACVLNLCEDHNEKIFVLASGITDIYYISHRQLHSKDKALKLIKQIMRLVEICDVNKEDIEMAAEMPGKDFEDCVMAACAIRHECKCIVTRNKKDFKDLDIKICTPKEFINTYPQDWIY